MPISPLWQLDQDILHCIYSEWLLSWRDLSALDIACLKHSDRTAWMSSLLNLRMTAGIINRRRRLSDLEMSLFYAWLGYHKVFLTEGFPIRLSVMQDIFLVLDSSPNYSSVIRSIEIDGIVEKPTVSMLLDKKVLLEEQLCVFLKQCSRLTRIRVITTQQQFNYNEEAGDDKDNDNEPDNLILSALHRGLKMNSLISIDFSLQQSPKVLAMDHLWHLLVHQTNSLQELHLHCETWSYDRIITTLLKTSIQLKKISLSGVSSSSMEILLDYLSSAGSLLEMVEVSYCGSVQAPFLGCKEFFLGIGGACPMLRMFQLKTVSSLDVDQMLVLSQFNQLCPQMTTFEYKDTYDIRSVSVIVNDKAQVVEYRNSSAITTEEKVAWIECLSRLLDRSQYELITLETPFLRDFMNYECTLLMKSKLSPYLINVEAVMSEAILVDVVRDFPRLRKLTVWIGRHEFSDASLAAIIEYGYGLKELCLKQSGDIPVHCSFSDKMISEMMGACKMLEVLIMPGAGCESVQTIVMLTKLKIVKLYDVTLEESDLDSLLSTIGVEQWPSSLKSGEIIGDHYRLNFMPQHSWWV